MLSSECEPPLSPHDDTPSISKSASAALHQLTIDNLSTIVCFLRNLDSGQLIQVGLELEALPEDMLAAWLREEDNVTITSGPPSWSSLVAALEAVGQRGIASNIKTGEVIYK